MLRRLCTVPVAILLPCLAATVSTLGCRVDDAPATTPDAAFPSEVAITVTPPSLVIRPGSSGRTKFVVRDGNGVAVPSYPLSFVTVHESGDGTGPNVRLSSTQMLTENDGTAALEIMVENLQGQSLPIYFSVKATCPGAVDAQIDVTVTTNAFSVEVVPIAAEDLLGAGTVRSTKLLLFDDTRCADLDIVNLSASAAKPRPAQTVAANTSWTFYGVAGSGSSAVVGQGLGTNTFVQIAGCVDIPGSALSESRSMRATLYMDRVFPVPRGQFSVSSDIPLNPPPPELAGLQDAWVSWSRCGLDPARLWLDCTLDALATTAADPMDCIPTEDSEGFVGNLAAARRGAVAAPVRGTASGNSETPCRGPLDKSGNRSLESIVDALFAATRGQLQADDLDKFPDELVELLSKVRLTSQLSVGETNSGNSYLVEHALASLSFPDAKAPAFIETSSLGLTSPTTQLVATLKAGQLALPNHSFTLRLGSAARAAFESTSLKSRGAQDTAGFIKAVFALAQWRDGNATLTGCAALDAAVCDQLKQARGCLAAACSNGLSALATKLTGVFASLNGDGYDFSLAGAAPVVDLGGDGLADGLGLGSQTGTTSASSGLWYAAFRAKGGDFGADGSWTASRQAGAP